MRKDDENRRMCVMKRGKIEVRCGSWKVRELGKEFTHQEFF
jgi:hypothetical protein